MNICLINTNRAWGGGEKWHARTARELSEKGHSVTVVTYRGAPLSERTHDVAEVEEMRIGNLSFLNPFKMFRVKRFFRSKKFDAVILNLPRDVKAFSKAAHRSGVKKVIYRRGMNHPIRASLVNRYFYLRFIDGIIANSEEVRRSVSAEIPELAEKVTVITNGIDPEDIRHKKEMRRDKILLGNLGRLVPQKGQSDLLELGHILKKQGIPFHLFIGGEGPLREKLEDQIRSKNLNEHISLMGEVEPEEFFKLFDVFVFTSRFEGMSNALLEALQYRKPVLCYSIESNAEVLTHGETGFMVPLGEPEQMVKYLKQMRDDPELYGQMQDEGKRVLEEKFDQKKLVSQLIEYLQAP